jgi:hypothetical protein
VAMIRPMSQSATVLEGWKAIGEALGLRAKPEAIRKRLHGWEVRDGLPVHRVRGRVFCTDLALQAWSGNVATSQKVTLRSVK